MKKLRLLFILSLLFLWGPLTFIVVRGAHPEAFARLFERDDLLTALGNSLILAAVSAAGSTLLGTFTAFALPQMPRFGRTLMHAGIVFPMLLPEIAFGLATMTWFIRMGIPLGWGTLAAAHIAFSFSYATIIMKGHVETLDRGMFEAARDLGAGRWGVLRHALLPQILPGLIAAFVTSFSLSLDDFLISFFVKGIDQMTLPIQIYGMMKLRVGPEIYAMSVVLFCISMVGVLLSQAWFHSRDPQSSAGTWL